MAMDVSGLQGGILALLATIIVGLLGWRGANKVGNDNARSNRESRFEENLQKRLDAALARNSELREELAQAKDGRALLERRLKERDQKITALLASMGPEERKYAERWMPDSAFAPLSDPPRKTPKKE